MIYNWLILYILIIYVYTERERREKMENLKDIIKQGIKNGGFTKNAYMEDITEKKGYIVSIEGFEKIYHINGDISEIEKDVINYINIIKNKRNHYIGLWVDDDKIYLDLSKHYKNKEKAVINGINNKQLAIYDIANNKSIPLTKNTYIVYYYNKAKNDIQYIKEYLNIKDLERDYMIRNAYNYITEDIDDIKALLKDKFIIVKDTINLIEL